MSKTLTFRLKNAPKKPGVYIFRDTNKKVIYIGKAKNLYKRVNSYFQKKHEDQKTILLVAKIASVDFIVTDNELEALILELNMIKKNRPAYNIEYKDDKSYPYIAITMNDEFPRISSTREAHRKGVRYFGPYISASSLRETIDTLRSIFKLRTCRGTTPGRASHRTVENGKTVYTPCLNYHIDKCMAPCAQKVSAEEYLKTVKKVIKFLEGSSKQTLKALEDDMQKAAEDENFEKAARLRDKIFAAQMVLSKQKVSDDSGEDLDIFGTDSRDGYFAVALFMVRGGKLLGSESFEFKEQAEKEPLLSFIKHYYHSTSYVPNEVLTAEELPDTDTLKTWLSDIKKAKVAVRKPQRGKKKRLVDLASKNAGHNLEFYLKRLQVESSRAMESLKQLKDNLSIETPYRIEAFDISNISGTSAVGSMVVFENAKPKKEHYRKFKIRFDEGINDYEMMAEIVARRLKGLSKTGGDKSFKTKPNLILVDGGKGQLSASKKMLDRYSTDIDIAALAKREEELFLPGKPDSIRLARNSAALRLVQSLRNEAHRFAIEYHRKLRSKKMLRSVLDDIEGIGEKRKKLLIDNFGSVAVIKKLDAAGLAKKTGFSSDLSKKILKRVASK